MRTHPTATATHYRPDIDGLRALAVMGVVLYHADARVIPGGFVGVDVFFVISGFLITTILLKQMDAGTLSIKTFYERRIRRIMPALFAMFGLVLLFGFWRMTPWDLKDLADSARYAIGSIANIFFHKAPSGYFADSVESMPLLHTWSLGVEEQFYVFFPLLLILAMRLGWNRRRMGWILGGACALSFGLCVWRMRTNASDCFYLLHFRAWELLVGSLLALWLPRWAAQAAAAKSRRMPHAIAHVLGVAGLLLIVGAMALLDKNSPFPGVTALAPCLGAAMLIAAGGLGHHHWVGRLLALRPVVLIGLISYSVYLWHWPMLVFQSYLNTLHPENLTLWHRVGMGLAALPLGYLSWRFIEQPFRGDRLKGWPLFASWAGISLVFLALTLVVKKNNGFESHMPERAKQLAAYDVKSLYFDMDTPNRPPVDSNIYGDLTKTPHLVLWGDSHAQALRKGLGEIARDHGASVRFYGRGANGPIVGMRKLRPGWTGASSPEKDQEYNAQVLEKIVGNDAIQGVILAARWSTYTEGKTELDGEPGTPIIGKQDGSPFTNIEEARQAYADNIRDTVARLRAAGKTVFLVYPSPELPFNAPKTLSREILIGHDVDRIEVPAQNIFFKRQAFVMGVLDSLPDGPDLVRIRPHTLLVENGHIRLIDGNKLFYLDDNHLSLDGVRLLRPLLEPIFNH